MELLEALNEMEEFLEHCTRIPMTRKVIVDEEKLLDFLDRVRSLLPEEVRKAKWLVQEREKLLAESRDEANRILEDARREIERRVEESEIVRQAQETAEDLLRRAEQSAREMRLGARDYADDVLARLEGYLEKIAKEVAAGRLELKNMK
ncbi:MAG: ATPase [Bacillota bacterium]